MTNYVNPEDVQPPVSIGSCACPGTPHDVDYATLVKGFGYGDIGQIERANRLGGERAATAVAILRGVKAWTLVLPDGKPRPIDAVQIDRLDLATANRLDDLLGELIHSAYAEPPPNGSGAPSESGSPESATSTQTSPAPEPSTTS